jgi:hypothetical protein
MMHSHEIAQYGAHLSRARGASPGNANEEISQ